MAEQSGTESAQSAESADSALGYEEARAELVAVVQQLEAGGTNLEESLALWERGERLARVCQSWLDGARQRLDAVLETDEAQDAETEDAAAADADEDEET